jgi:peptide deformylase
MTRSVCTYGNPVLRKKAEKVTEVNDEIRSLIDEMFKMMYVEQGIGLAAEQFGSTKAVFILDVPEQADLDELGCPLNPGVVMPQAFINPEIIGASAETDTADEGCLSFPGMYVPVTRPAEVVVRFINRDGAEQVLNAKGLLARAIQHELDHLNGVLLVDHMSKALKVKNGLLLRKFKKQNKTSI